MPPRRLGLWPIAGVVAALVVLDLCFFPQTLEDAFITFRYADHLAEGHGFGAWNTTGERVEGYSSFLWMVLLAGAGGTSTATVAKLLGIACHAALTLLLLCFPRQACQRFSTAPAFASGQAFTIAGLITAFYLPIAWYSVTGMETLWFSLIVALNILGPLIWKRPAFTAALTVVTVFSRPEGVLVAVAAAAFHFVRAKLQGEPVRGAVVAAASGIVAAALLVGLRWIMYGAAMPNGYYAKHAGDSTLAMRLGVAYAMGWANAHGTWLLLSAAVPVLAIWNARWAGRPAALAPAFLFGFSAVYIGLVIGHGGDNPYAFPYWRHFIHVFPFVALLLGYAAASTPRPLRLAAVVACAGGLIAANRAVLQMNDRAMATQLATGLRGLPALSHQPPSAYIQWLARYSTSSTVIASAYGGEIPYVIDAVHVDVLGLNDRHIAHAGRLDPAGPIDSKTDMNYVVSRRPDIIEGYVSGTAIRRGLPLKMIVRGRRQMMTQMLENPMFRRDYVFIVNAPYEVLDRAVFMHADFWRGHSNRAELAAIPVGQTSLYDSGASGASCVADCDEQFEDKRRRQQKQ